MRTPTPLPKSVAASSETGSLTGPTFSASSTSVADGAVDEVSSDSPAPEVAAEAADGSESPEQPTSTIARATTSDAIAAPPRMEWAARRSVVRLGSTWRTTLASSSSIVATITMRSSPSDQFST